jgi:hypothetical protein
MIVLKAIFTGAIIGITVSLIGGVVIFGIAELVKRWDKRGATDE